MILRSSRGFLALDRGYSSTDRRFSSTDRLLPSTDRDDDPAAFSILGLFTTDPAALDDVPPGFSILISGRLTTDPATSATDPASFATDLAILPTDPAADRAALEDDSGRIRDRGCVARLRMGRGADRNFGRVGFEIPVFGVSVSGIRSYSPVSTLNTSWGLGFF